MKTYKEKLTELFKTVPEIKSDLEKLRFGTYVDYKENPDMGRIKGICLGKGYQCGINIKLNTGFIKCDFDFSKLKWGQGFEIIGNPIEERHLRMFCDKKGIEISINEKGYIRKYTQIYTGIGLNNGEILENQTEGVFEKLYNFLKKTLEK